MYKIVFPPIKKKNKLNTHLLNNHAYLTVLFLSLNQIRLTLDLDRSKEFLKHALRRAQGDISPQHKDTPFAEECCGIQSKCLEKASSWT